MGNRNSKQQHQKLKEPDYKHVEPEEECNELRNESTRRADDQAVGTEMVSCCNKQLKKWRTCEVALQTDSQLIPARVAILEELVCKCNLETKGNNIFAILERGYNEAGLCRKQFDKWQTQEIVLKRGSVLIPAQLSVPTERVCTSEHEFEYITHASLESEFDSSSKSHFCCKNFTERPTYEIVIKSDGYPSHLIPADVSDYDNTCN